MALRTVRTITLTAPTPDALGHSKISLSQGRGQAKAHGTLTNVSTGHWTATIGYIHRTYTVKGYSTAAAALAALQAKVIAGWHWRR